MRPLLLLSLLLMLACRKTEPVPPMEDPAPQPKNYLPLTKGSWWKYRYQKKDSPDAQFFTVTVLPNDTAIHNDTYTVLSRKLPSRAFLPLLKRSNDTIFSLDPYQEAAPHVVFTNHAEARWQWTLSEPGGLHPLTAFNFGELKETDLHRPAAGVEHADVAHVQFRYATSFSDLTNSTSKWEEVFLAPGVGIIYVKYDGVHEYFLEDYFIAP